MAFFEYLVGDLAFQLVPIAVMVLVVVIAKRRANRRKAQQDVQD